MKIKKNKNIPAVKVQKLNGSKGTNGLNTIGNSNGKKIIKDKATEKRKQKIFKQLVGDYGRVEQSVTSLFKFLPQDIFTTGDAENTDKTPDKPKNKGKSKKNFFCGEKLSRQEAIEHLQKTLSAFDGKKLRYEDKLIKKGLKNRIKKKLKLEERRKMKQEKSKTKSKPIPQPESSEKDSESSDEELAESADEELAESEDFDDSNDTAPAQNSKKKLSKIKFEVEEDSEIDESVQGNGHLLEESDTDDEHDDISPPKESKRAQKMRKKGKKEENVLMEVDGNVTNTVLVRTDSSSQKGGKTKPSKSQVKVKQEEISPGKKEDIEAKNETGISKKQCKRELKQALKQQKKRDKRTKVRALKKGLGRTEVESTAIKTNNEDDLKDSAKKIKQEKDTLSVGSMMFNRFDFTGSDTAGKTKHIKDPKRALQMLEKTKAKIQEFKTKGMEDKAERVKEKQAWSSAILRAEGVKVKDDPELLRKSIRKKENMKSRSKKNWDKREEQVKQKMDDAQKKRKDNIMAKKKEKKAKKMKRAVKKGRVVL